ncbi:uncharacterized protein BCR38DRAFT_222935 [Pseudomassariella vexata]|uniref:DUF221-domain-containing protein n=1 Tax=Pseudomassariella vexata TaxID=1141098 RepID=A0A1Y2DV65_9PEZI|nr:uncharacterized protein BCR38DRAFT_222935 [Pseudomassariella vexata]ORY63163.1 hypothetical protein BCR38DRAFT_222935 [Pseudomassariella vexata]
MSDTGSAGTASKSQGINLVAFSAALTTSLVVFGVQTGLFLLLRTKLARIFKPKTYLVPDRERTEPPPDSPWGMVHALWRFKDREIIKKCGLDSYFFLRYLQTLLVIFVPIALIVIPILIPLNFNGGKSMDINSNATAADGNLEDHPTGLDTLAWGNVKPERARRYWAHLVLAVLVIVWVCGVFFSELRIYIKVRQDYLTTAEHRLRASATTVLVNAVPEKWLSEEALRGLFDVFPGGIRNVWLTRDFTKLLDKIKKRDEVHLQLEGAQTELIRMAKKKQLKRREAEEKAARKAARAKGPTKEERAQRQQDEDAAAKLQAESGAGASSGDKHEIPHDIDDGLMESREIQDTQDKGSSFDLPALSHGFSKLTHGLGRGVGGITQGLGKGVGAVGKTLGQVDDELETTNGFVTLAPAARDQRHIQFSDEDRPPTRGSDHHRLVGHTQPNSTATRVSHSHHDSVTSQYSLSNNGDIEMKKYSNTTRKASNLDAMYINETPRWYEFWKPPPGGFASPLPQGLEDEEFPFKTEKTVWQKIKGIFVSDEDTVEYPPAFNKEVKEAGDEGAEWEKWLKKSDRPTHRLAIFEWTPGFLPGLPLLNRKVDTIYWCREELARLNLEIEEDQNHPERYPLMRSAFVQFNHQAAAHMACQSVTHHVPRHMAPRMVEISPNDVIWDNMAISWWAEWMRTIAVVAIVTGMIILWAIPVGFTSSLSQITDLIDQFPWLGFLEDNVIVLKAVQALAGVLPAILLALLLWLVPVIMDLLAGFKGAKTGSQKAETVQMFYFAFLFVQVFLVVSVASFSFDTFDKIFNNPGKVAELLATNLPKSANYFFSYMILQSLSTSSGTLLQIGALVGWYVIAKITNNTARNKWNTNTKLPNVKWGSYFPVYTNFACIALVYSVVAPLISVFAIVTFSLLWMANRYSMLYVNRFTIDTGGVLYPRAINQTFAGLYVMEICLIGLFFIVEAQADVDTGFPQAVIMIIVTVLTILFQIMLNRSFGPLFRYLPITFEDEAALRDEAFQRAQDQRLGLLNDDHDDDAYDKEGLPAHHPGGSGPAPTTDGVGGKAHRGKKFTHFKPVKGLTQAGKTIKNKTYGKAEQGVKSAARYREERRKKDLESQRAIGDALYGGFHDEIEDLTPDERDVLVQRAFMHSALRARCPTVWIPRDDIGISDDEIRRTREFSDHIWISNEGTALDSKVRVVYGRAPPDFSEIDLINL